MTFLESIFPTTADILTVLTIVVKGHGAWEYGMTQLRIHSTGKIKWVWSCMAGLTVYDEQLMGRVSV